MTLELIPNGDLVFKGPFSVVSMTALKLSNSGNERLAYKIKTTAPKRYCVKPNSGFLDAHATASVQVMLQPQAPGQPDDRSKHKFMVQWVAVPSTYTDDVDNFWKQDLKGLNVQDSKLKCVFAEDQSAAVVPNDSHEYRTADASATRANVSDDANKARPSYNDIERLKSENESLREKLRQFDSGLRQRTTGGHSASDRSKSAQQQNGLVLFGIALTEPLVLVAFVFALLFGFSLGYFFFSCSN